MLRSLTQLQLVKEIGPSQGSNRSPGQGSGGRRSGDQVAVGSGDQVAVGRETKATLACEEPIFLTGWSWVSDRSMPGSQEIILNRYVRSRLGPGSSEASKPAGIAQLANVCFFFHGSI